MQKMMLSKDIAYRAEKKATGFYSLVFKRLLDVVLALVLCIPFLLLLPLLYFLIKKDGGCLFFSHQRVGKNYQKFQCHKFRTMVVNPDIVLEEHLKKCQLSKKEWQECQKLKNDPRITPIGKFLRKSSLDELPQLFNILKGDMSLVGPRPVTEPELEKYGQYADTYAAVRPGLTGLWQVSGRNDISYDERVRLDVEYVQNSSLLTDMRILFKTVGVVLKPRGSY